MDGSTLYSPILYGSMHLWVSSICEDVRMGFFWKASVGKFVRDFERWPKPNDTHTKEDLLATRVAKAKKEFDVAHRTELQDLQKDLENKLDKDSRERIAEGLLKEVKDLGHWSNPPPLQ